MREAGYVEVLQLGRERSEFLADELGQVLGGGHGAEVDGHDVAHGPVPGLQRLSKRVDRRVRALLAVEEVADLKLRARIPLARQGRLQVQRFRGHVLNLENRAVHPALLAVARGVLLGRRAGEVSISQERVQRDPRRHDVVERARHADGSRGPVALERRVELGALRGLPAVHCGRSGGEAARVFFGEARLLWRINRYVVAVSGVSDHSNEARGRRFGLARAVEAEDTSTRARGARERGLDILDGLDTLDAPPRAVARAPRPPRDGGEPSRRVRGNFGRRAPGRIGRRGPRPRPRIVRRGVLPRRLRSRRDPRAVLPRRGDEGRRRQRRRRGGGTAVLRVRRRGRRRPAPPDARGADGPDDRGRRHRVPVRRAARGDGRGCARVRRGRSMRPAVPRRGGRPLAKHARDGYTHGTDSF